MTTTKNIIFHRGETWRVDFNLKGPTGTPLLVEGSDQVTVRVARGSARPIKSIIGDGITVVNGTGGVVAWVVPDAIQDLSLIGNKVYSYECFYSSPVRGDSVQAKGTLTVLKSLKETVP